MIKIILILIATIIIKSATPLLVFEDKESKWHFIDTDFKAYMIRDDIITYGGYSEGLHRVFLNIDNTAKWCFVNDSGEVVIKTKYDEVGDFYDGMSLVYNKTPTAKFTQKFGFINKKGEEVIPPTKYDAINFSEGKAYIMDRYKRGYINRRGEYVITLPDTIVGYRFSEGKASISTPSLKVGLIDSTGKQLINCNYDEPFLYKEGLSKASFNGKTGIIDSNYNLVVPIEYYEVKSYNQGRTFVSKRGKDNRHEWALVDKKGNFLTDHEYLQVRDFNQGLAAVQSMYNGWMWLDRNGDRFLNLYLRYLDNFYGDEELAWCSGTSEEGTFFGGFINKSGELLFLLGDYQNAFDLRANRQVY